MSFKGKLLKIIQIEKTRYQRRGGLNIIIAIVLLVTVMYSASLIGPAIWPSQIQDKVLFLTITSFVLHTTTQIFCFLLYAPAYFNLTQIYEPYLINKRSSKPWQRKNWVEVRQKTVKNLVLNQLIVYPLMVYVSTRFGGIRLRFDQNFPSFLQIFVQTYIIYFIEDFFFYWGHRCFHEFKVLYKMHKIHHEYDTLYTLITEYFHPLDFVLANLLPSAMGFIILGNRVHCSMFFFWQIWKIFISTQGHCGYEIPWSPGRIFFFVAGPSYHDHHHSHNVGNYSGSCYLWDLMLDTNVPYYDDFLKQKGEKLN